MKRTAVSEIHCIFYLNFPSNRTILSLKVDAQSDLLSDTLLNPMLRPWAPAGSAEGFALIKNISFKIKEGGQHVAASSLWSSNPLSDFMLTLQSIIVASWFSSLHPSLSPSLLHFLRLHHPRSPAHSPLVFPPLSVHLLPSLYFPFRFIILFPSPLPSSVIYFPPVLPPPQWCFHIKRQRLCHIWSEAILEVSWRDQKAR